MNFDDYGLGRREAPDARDLNHLISRTLFEAPAEPPKPRKRPYHARRSLLQGRTSTCVGHAWRHWLQAAPEMLREGVGLDPYDIYRRCVVIDQWTANDREATAPNDQLNFGTSVRAGAEVMVELGYIKKHTPKDPKSGYKWSFDLEQALPALLGLTPLVAGTWWTQAMFTPDAEGVIRYDGRGRVGGHAYTWHWHDAKRGLVLIQNSWVDWGIDHPYHKYLKGYRGFAWMPDDSADRLIREGGELCTALQTRPRR